MFNFIKKIFKVYPTNKEIFERAKKGDKSILTLPKEKLMIKNEWGETPLHWLAARGVKEILEVDKSLLMIQDNEWGNTPIHYLASNGVKEILRVDKELLMIQNNNGWTPIHCLADNEIEIPEELKRYI